MSSGEEKRGTGGADRSVPRPMASKCFEKVEFLRGQQTDGTVLFANLQEDRILGIACVTPFPKPSSVQRDKRFTRFFKFLETSTLKVSGGLCGSGVSRRRRLLWQVEFIWNFYQLFAFLKDSEKLSLKNHGTRHYWSSTNYLYYTSSAILLD